MKKLVVFVLSVVMAAALVGGGGSSGAPATEAPAETQAAETQAAETEAAEAQETQAPAAPAGDAVKIIVSVVDVEDSVCGLCVEDFKNYVEEASGGSIKVETNYNGVLGDDIANAQAVLMNTIQMSLVQSDVLSEWIGDLKALYLPYTFESYDQYFNAMDNELFDSIYKAARDSGYTYLGFAEAGARHLWTDKTEIHSPADLKGVSLRAPQAQITVSFLESIGANATPIAFTEIYTSIQNGVVNGLENPFDLAVSMHFDEVTNYVTKDYHFYTPLAWITSNDFFDSLSEEQQQIIRDGSKVLQESNRTMLAETEEKEEQDLKDKGMTIIELTDEEHEVFREATLGMADEYAAQCSEEIIGIVMKYRE